MLSFHITPSDSQPLYEQIYEQIRERILNGTLKEGQKMPSTRSLSTSLDVSRSTIDTAYYQLLSEGFIDSKPKSGFYVCHVDPSDYLVSQDEKNTFSTSSHKTTEKKEATPSTHWKCDFSPYAVDISGFPFSIWKRLSKQCLNNNNDLFLLGDNLGDLALRKAICDYVTLSREVHCTPEQIVIGAGADFLLQMLSMTFRSLGINTIATENPCYKKAARIFADNKIIPQPGILDEKGLVVSSISKDSLAVYVTPSHEYPLGMVMPYGRRKELLQWAKTRKRYIIEDDHDSEFRYKGKPLPSLQGMDKDNTVIYIGTFSKSIAPSIRAGYMILPTPLLTAYKNTCGHYSCTVSRLEQAVLTRFLSERHFEKHVNRMRKTYKGKHDAMIRALLPATKKHGITIIGDNAGLHLILLLPKHLSEEKLCQKAKKLGLKLYGLKEHYLPSNNNSPQNGLLFGYSNLSYEEIADGIQLFIQLLDDCSSEDVSSVKQE